MKENATIVCFGDINVDVLMSINKYPPIGGDAMASRVTLRPGGSVANTGIVLAKLGGSVKMISRVGNDHWADIALKPLIEAGVDITNVSHDHNDSTGLIFIPVPPGGERTMLSYRGANVHKSRDEITSEVLQDAGWLHVSSYNFLVIPQREASWHVVELAHSLGVRISMDIGVEPAITAKEDLLNLFPKLSLVVLSPDEGEELIGINTPEKVVEECLDIGVDLVGLKLGKDGCLIGDCNQNYLLPGFAIQPVDTTGAGDAFCAGLIFAQVFNAGLKESGLLANALGALAATVWGGGDVLPGSNELLSFFGEYEKYLYDQNCQSEMDNILELIS